MRTRLYREFREFLACEALTIATAIVVVTLLHDQVLEAYPVPSRSMEPAIEGDPTLGDRVLVDKLWDDLAEPRRFDLVVFWREEERKTIVKRVAGLPREWIKIDDGDLLVGRTATSLERVVKHPARDHDLFRCLWDSRVAPGFEGGFLRRDGASRLLPGGGLEHLPEGVDEAALFTAPRLPGVPGHGPFAIAFGRRLTTGYLDGFDRLQDSTFMARDFGAELELRGSPASRLWIELRYGELCLLLEYDGKGRARLWSGTEGRYEPLGQDELACPPLGRSPDGSCSATSTATSSSPSATRTCGPCPSTRARSRPTR
ncbi:MAG: signal peptidase I [Planctomycetota bacterium]